MSRDSHISDDIGPDVFSGRLVIRFLVQVLCADFPTESPIQPKGPRVPESPYGAQSLRDHPSRVNGIFSGVSSRWFVEPVAIIRIPS